MSIGKEQRQARINVLDNLLKNESDRLEGRAMILAMQEMYSLVCEDLQERQQELRDDIVDIRSHRKSAINAGCDDDLVYRANQLLWSAMATDLKMDADIETFKGFVTQLQKELRD